MKFVIYLFVLLTLVMSVQAVDVFTNATFETSINNASFVFQEDVLNFTVISVDPFCLNSTINGLNFSFCDSFPTLTQVNLTNLNFTTLTPTLDVIRVTPVTNITVFSGQSFDYSVNVTCLITDCGIVEVDLFSNLTLINTIPGSIPFDVDLANPLFVNLSFNSTASITYSVTANINDNATFNFISQASILSTPSIFNQSSNLSVTVLITLPFFNISASAGGEDFQQFIWT